MKSRFDVSRHSSFDDAMITRQSCHIIEQVGKDYFCDCHEGIKGRLCKHSVGLMYKCGTLEITSDVRSKPLGQKRRRGRPKKMPHCLTHSPEPRTVGPVPRALYLPSPNSSILEVSDSQPTASPSRISNTSYQRPDISTTDTSLSPVFLPPVLNSTFVASTPALEDLVSAPVLNSTLVAITEPPPETPDIVLTSMRKRSRDVEELPPAKRISRKCASRSQKPLGKATKSTGNKKTHKQKQSIVTIVTCDIPANILDLSNLSSEKVVKPRRGRSAKK